MKNKAALVTLLLILAPVFAMAQTTPVGLWKTIDDDGATEKSFVRVSEASGIITGKVEKIVDPSHASAKCVKCKDARKDQPIVGMTIIDGVRQDPSQATQWGGGEILDPDNGKTYKVRLKPTEGGKKMEVRGYIGTPLFGRTQTWVRVE